MTAADDGAVPRYDALDKVHPEVDAARLAELRRTCPVSTQTFGPNPPLQVATRYDDIVAVYKSTRGFSNAHGTALDQSLPPPTDERNIFFLDPPEHGPIRRILLSAVSPRAVEAAAPYIEELAAATVAAMPPAGPVDLNAVWATPIPARVICHMLGVPEDDYPDFLRWTKAKTDARAMRSHGSTELDDALRRATEEFEAYLQAQIDRRRRSDDPPDDLITGMLRHRGEGGEAMSDHEIAINAIFLLNAGNRTTANLMCNLLYLLLVEPERYRRVRADRALVPLAMEEALRLLPPIQSATRAAIEPTEVGGCPVGAGDVVVLSNLAANRDPAVWGERADRFDVDHEQPVRHLGFGLGVHACLGAALARRVTVICVNALLDRFETLALAPDFEWSPEPYWTTCGTRRLAVTWP